MATLHASKLTAALTDARLRNAVSIAIGALLVIQAVSLSQDLSGRGLQSGTVSVRGAGRLASAPPSPLDYASQIAAAHLFGSVAPDPATVAAHPSSGPLQLTGTLATDDPHHGTAIISSAGTSGTYPVGAPVDGAVVQAVYADHVILERGGALEYLKLPREGAALLVGNNPTAVAPPQPALAAVAPAAPAPPADVPAQLPHQIADVVRAGGPVADSAGRPHGFRIFPGRDRSAFLAAGLHGGDVVVAVNGQPVLARAQDSQGLFRTFAMEPHANITVERNGQTQEIAVDVPSLAVRAN